MQNTTTGMQRQQIIQAIYQSNNIVYIELQDNISRRSAQKLINTDYQHYGDVLDCIPLIYQTEWRTRDLLTYPTYIQLFKVHQNGDHPITI